MKFRIRLSIAALSAAFFCQPLSVLGQGLPPDEAMSLAADMLLLKWENNVDQCEHMGASNMSALFSALRLAQEYRRTNLPVVTSRSIERAKSGYKNGLQQLPVQVPEKRDQIALICDRVEQRLLTLAGPSMNQLAERWVSEFGLR